jgi:hypothetical protein
MPTAHRRSPSVSRTSNMPSGHPVGVAGHQGGYR